MKKILIAACLLTSVAAFSQNSGTIFLVRHAERESSAGDSPLSPAGSKRADCLAKTLADANITPVLTSEFKRTQQTAAPPAEVQKITPIAIPAVDAKAA